LQVGAVANEVGRRENVPLRHLQVALFVSVAGLSHPLEGFPDLAVREIGEVAKALEAA
jgi:hypothetical protein